MIWDWRPPGRGIVEDTSPGLKAVWAMKTLGLVLGLPCLRFLGAQASL